MLNANFEKNSNRIIFLIFSLIFIIGITSVKDYGVSSDEADQRHSGFMELHNLGKKILPNLTEELSKGKTYGDINDKNYKEKYAGHLINSISGVLEVILNIEDKRDAFLLRHYLYFLIFFFGLVTFYHLCQVRFENWKISLLGVLFLLLSPRILANSFYDPKDIPFLSLLIFSVYFGLSFFKKINLKNAIIFSIFSGLVISGIRIYGLISPILIYSAIFIYQFYINKLNSKKLLIIIFSIFLTIIFTIIFKPYLWQNSIANFYNTIKYIGEFGEYWNIPNLFLGEIVYAKDVPWFYSPFWIIITTPIFYIILFFIGIFFYFLKILTNFKKNFFIKEFYFDSIFITLFFAPLIGSIILSSSSFNAWRHLYFIYPYFIIFSLLGYKKLINFFDNKNYKKAIFFNTLLIIFFYIFWIVKNHPHQYVFFNFLAGKELNKKFDIDYWGLSYMENLNYILDHDSRKKIYIKNNSLNKPVIFLNTLHEEKRNRFIYNFDNKDPDYIITNYFLDKIKKYKEYSNDKLKKDYFIFKEIIVDGNVINTVYKKKEN